MAIQLYETRQILFKTETTPGTDAAPTGAANAILSFSGQVQVEADKLTRTPDLPYFGADPFLLVHKRATVSFEIELIGSSTVGNAAPIGPVLTACGMAETLVAATSATYNPITGPTQKTGTLYFYIGPLRYTMVYAMGNIEVNQEVKGFNRGKVSVTGVITNTTMPTENVSSGFTVAAFQAPPAVEMENWIVTSSTVHLNTTKLNVNYNNDIKIHEASELRAVQLMDRKPSGSLTYFEPTLASFNPWALANNYTLQNIVSTVGITAGKICTLTMPTVQLEYTKLTEQDKAILFETPMAPLPSAGNDEISIKFT